jgi:alpha-1,3-glucosyltransferase
MVRNLKYESSRSPTSGLLSRCRYDNTTDNDLRYWGLDYPPLTAYHSWLCGAVASRVNPSWVSLHLSRGFESYHHKLFMRYTVLAVDVLVYFTAAVVFSRLVYKNKDAMWERISLLGLLLLAPALIIIDHGHFQYNCASLGLTFWAIIAVTTDHDVTGSVLFSLALNYKQMELYHAVPFFCYLLGKSVAGSGSGGEFLKRVGLLGVAVVGTFVACWFPFLGSWDRTLQVTHRLFPFARGLYEDKVANVWCSLSVLVKLRRLFSLSALVKVTAVSTVTALVPSSWNLLRNPTPFRFILALVNSSLIFFLLSYQVHEKSILLALLPCSLLTPHHPHTVTWFQLLAVFSMYPLITKDGLVLACWALAALYTILSLSLAPSSTSKRGRLSRAAHIVGPTALSLLIALCVTSHFVPPPPHLPHILPVLISSTSCLLLIPFTILTHVLQFTATPTTYFKEDTPTSDVTKETKETKTVATNKPKRVYEKTGRQINISYPLVPDKQKKLN